MILLLAGISDSKVDDGPVRAGIIVLGRPERARCVSDRQSSPDNSRGIILCQQVGSVGFVAAVEVQVETILDGGLNEIHVWSDEVRHDCDLGSVPGDLGGRGGCEDKQNIALRNCESYTLFASRDSLLHRVQCSLRGGEDLNGS